MIITVFDTETSGLTKFRSPYCDPGQPGAMSVGAVTINYLTGEVENYYSLVKIGNLPIDDKALEVHGITREKSNDEGIEPREAIAELETRFAKSDFVSAYNINFDDIIYKAMVCRAEEGPRNEEERPFYAAKPTRCIMNICTNHFRIPKKTGSGGFVPLKLSQSYKRIVGVELRDAHNALIDAQAACDIQTILLQQQYEAAQAAGKNPPPMKFTLLTVKNV
jgi:DNA polymerase-3 subunit epsilon